MVFKVLAVVLNVLAEVAQLKFVTCRAIFHDHLCRMIVNAVVARINSIIIICVHSYFFQH